MDLNQSAFFCLFSTTVLKKSYTNYAAWMITVSYKVA